MFSKKKDEKDKVVRNPGIVDVYSNFFIDSSRKMMLAWTWIPRLKALIVVFFAIAMIFALASVYTVYNRPDAILFMSFPDGTIACAPIVNQQGGALKRSGDAQRTCDRLSPPIKQAQEN